MYVQKDLGAKFVVKLRFRIGNMEFVGEGSVEEIKELIARLAAEGYRTERLEESRPKLKEYIPDQETLIRYILSKPNFEHNLFEVAEHFLGRRLSSSGPDAKTYNALYRRLERVRRKIEVDYGGKFEAVWVHGKGGELYKVFRFIKGGPAVRELEKAPGGGGGWALNESL
ncbi:MAG: hypothetical protein ACXQTV_01840 [Candidatus Hecatellaceae archaeon]